MTAEQLIEEIKRMDPAELAKLLVYLRVVWPPERPGEATPLSECLAMVDTPEGRARTAAVLAARSFPHYEAGPGPGLLVKIESDGTRTVGRFANREFRPVDARKRNVAAVYSRGRVTVRFRSGVQISFPVTISPRLAAASRAALREIEVSPFGLHWPALDEDLSFAGLLRGTRS